MEIWLAFCELNKNGTQQKIIKNEVRKLKIAMFALISNDVPIVSCEKFPQHVSSVHLI